MRGKKDDILKKVKKNWNKVEFQSVNTISIIQFHESLLLAVFAVNSFCICEQRWKEFVVWGSSRKLSVDTFQQCVFLRKVALELSCPLCCLSEVSSEAWMECVFGKETIGILDLEVPLGSAWLNCILKEVLLLTFFLNVFFLFLNFYMADLDLLNLHFIQGNSSFHLEL